MVKWLRDQVKPRKISVIGIGYVGLVTGVVFAKHGFKTVCTDINEMKVNSLNEGSIHFWEPGLKELIEESVRKGLLSGSTDNVEAVSGSDISFICVGTPTSPDGSSDLSAVHSCSEDIGKALKDRGDYHVAVVKSSVPPGTTDGFVIPTIEKISGKRVGEEISVCVNPEFLREGSALQDGLSPDRIVIGESDKRGGDTLSIVYEDFPSLKLVCDIRTAEMIKYATNSLLATKISFANEFSRICEEYNIDVYEVMRGVGLDSRINPRFLDAGVGFGGSCFPKDVKAIIFQAKKANIETPLLDAVLNNNEIQPLHFVDLIKKYVGGIRGKTVAFLGLSFKPNTDDTRETRALPIIELLYKEGARVKAYDPKAIPNFRAMTNLHIEYVNSWEEALRGSDFAVIQADWKEFREINAEDYKRLLKLPIVIDGRRTYDPNEFVNKGVKYVGVGWKNARNP